MAKKSIQEWLRTPTGNYTLIGLMILISGGFVYFMFFSETNDNSNKNSLDKSADVNVDVRDSIFKKKKNVYYVTGKKGNKKIMKEDDFFAFKDNVEELKEAVDSVDTVIVEEIDYDKIADSILQANNQKVNYNSASRKSSYNSSSQRKRTRKSTQDNDWLKRAKKQNQEFFNTPSAEYEEKQNYVHSKEPSIKTDEEIYAVVYRDQTVLNKGRVGLRLGKDAIINNVLYKRNTVFYGFVTFAKNRIYIDVNSINNIPVKLKAFDAQDNSLGIYTEVQFQNLANNEVQDDIVDEVDVNGIPLGKTVKNIFKKKKRIDKITLFNEYKLTLKSR